MFSKKLLDEHTKTLRPFILSLATLGLAWNFALPFGGASPDETTYFHYGVYETNKITGIKAINRNEGYQTPKETHDFIDRPCFAFDKSISATCQDIPEFSKFINTPSRLGDYPKPWFWITSIPAILISSDLSFLASRTLAVLINLVIITLGIIFWSRGSRRLFLSLLLSMTPLATSTIFSYNPNGFEISILLSMSLMLYGKARFTEEKDTRATWWVTFTLLGISSAFAKPMTGVMTLGIIALYSVFSVIRKEDTKSSLDNRRSRSALLALGFLFCIFSIYQSIDALLLGQEFTKDVSAQNQLSVLNFFMTSDSFFIQNAGLFGWMDTYPAPWMQLTWLGVFFVVMFLSLQSVSKHMRLLLYGTFLSVFLLAPAIAAYLLQMNHGGIFQTRYLSGVFGSVVILAASNIVIVNEKHIKNLQVVLFSILLINLFWIFLRYSLGLGLVTQNPMSTLGALFNNQNWQPVFSRVFVILLILSVIYFITSLRDSGRNLKDMKFTYLAIAFILFGAARIDLSVSSSKSEIYSEIIANTPQVPAGEIYGDKVFSQSFVPEKNGLHQISIMFATYARQNTKSISFRLLDSDKNILKEESFSAANVEDNKYITFDFSPIHDSSNRYLRVEISSMNSTVGDAVTVWLSLNDVYGQGKAYLGENELAGDLNMAMKFSQK